METPANFNNTSNSFEAEVKDLSVLLQGYGILFLTLLGLPANIISVKVFCHSSLRSPLTILLIGLTVSDIIALVCMFLTLSLTALCDGSSWYNKSAAPILKVGLHPFLWISRMTSVYFTILITLER